MSDPLESLRQHYLDTLARSLPMHRLAIFLIFLLLSIGAIRDNSSSMILAAFDFRLTDLFSPDDGLIWELTLADIVLATGLTVFNRIALIKITVMSFSSLVRIGGRDNYISNLHDVLTKCREECGAIAPGYLDYLSKTLAIRQKELERFQMMAEVLLALALYVISIGPRSTFVDWVAAAVAALGVIALQWAIFSTYTSKFFPLYVVYQGARGGFVEFQDDLLNARIHQASGG